MPAATCDLMWNCSSRWTNRKLARMPDIRTIVVKQKKLSVQFKWFLTTSQLKMFYTQMAIIKTSKRNYFSDTDEAITTVHIIIKWFYVKGFLNFYKKLPTTADYTTQILKIGVRHWVERIDQYVPDFITPLLGNSLYRSIRRPSIRN